LSLYEIGSRDVKSLKPQEEAIFYDFVSGLVLLDKIGAYIGVFFLE